MPRDAPQNESFKAALKVSIKNDPLLIVRLAPQHYPGSTVTHLLLRLCACARQVMNAPYASAVGTTVLQLTEVPEPPATFDGVIAIFGPTAGLDEKQIRATLETVGRIDKVETRSSPPWVVSFAMHADAVKAIERFARSDLWENLDTLYNEVRLSLDRDRLGWPRTANLHHPPSMRPIILIHLSYLRHSHSARTPSAAGVASRTS